MKKGRGLRTSDVSLLREGGASFQVTLYPSHEEEDVDDWWYCTFSIHTQRDPNTQNKQTRLLTSRGDIWRMRDLNKARKIIAEIFVDLDEMKMKLNAVHEDVLLTE